MKASAIIVAAGSGVRLGKQEPKAFVKIGGHTMLWYSLAVIAKIDELGELVITVPTGFETAAREEVKSAGVEIPVKITLGGVERQDSVRIALGLTSASSELVVVHDAARPLADVDIFRRCFECAARIGAAIAAVPVADTLKRVVSDDAGGAAIVGTVARAGLWQAQTPQAFRRDLLVEAHQRAVEQKIAATDDADLIERIGGRVEVFEASSRNLKITTVADLAMAEAVLASRR